MRLKLSLTVLALLAVTLFAADGDPNANLDKQIFDVLKELNNRGADLNNTGDPVGCYRTYQGGLTVLKAMMPHRPAAQKSIDDGLAAADKKPLPDRAFALHTTITEVRALVKPAVNSVRPTMPITPSPNTEVPKPAIVPPPAAAAPVSFPDPVIPAPAIPAPALPSTLWDRLGGETKIESMVEEWIMNSLADAKVDLTKGGTQKLEGENLVTCKRRLVGYLSTLSDGTVPYVGKAITDAHAGIPTQGEAFTAFLGHLKSTLIKNKVETSDIESLIMKIEVTK